MVFHRQAGFLGQEGTDAEAALQIPYEMPPVTVSSLKESAPLPISFMSPDWTITPMSA